MEQTKVHAYFAQQRQWAEDILCRLLAIQSESGDEAAASRFLKEELDSIGIMCQWQPLDNSLKNDPEYSFPARGLDYTGRGNLILRQEGGDKHLSLNTHIDVVPPSPGQKDPYKPAIDAEGRIWARGACDAKGQVVSMLLLFKAAKELGDCDNAITGHIVVEEELGGNGTLGVLRACPDFTADAMVNLEPTDLRISPAIRGAVWFEMTFEGVAGHAGSSANTFSATDKAIAAIALLKKYHADLLERSRDCGLYVGITNPMPLTIGKFQAGVWPSMVPGRAQIAGVLGFLHNTTKQKVMDEFRELFAKEENRWISDGMTMEFSYRHNAVNTAVDHWLTQAMSEACSTCGLSGKPVAMTASTDAIYYQERGIPSLAFGPGKISDAHSCHENILTDDVLKAGEVLYTLYKSM